MCHRSAESSGKNKRMLGRSRILSMARQLSYHADTQKHTYGVFSFIVMMNKWGLAVALLYLSWSCTAQAANSDEAPSWVHGNVNVLD